MSTMQVKWFLQLRGNVQGPFSNENLLKALQGIGDDNYGQALVWRRGLSEWVHANQWQKADQQINAVMNRAATSNAPAKTSGTTPKPVATPTSTPKASVATTAPKPSLNETATVMNPINQQTQATVMQTNIKTSDPGVFQDDEFTRTSIDNDLFEKTFTQAFADGMFYRVQVNFVDQPLMSKNELLQLIAKQEDVSAISIQDSKTKEWKEIYAYPDLVEKLGISRRKSQRVPILAQFNGKTSKSNSVSYRVITISEGGMGFTENFDLKIGDEVEGQISSPHFFQPISVKADVIYSGLDGYIGLKFSSVSDETKSAIIQYIKKFGKNQKS